VPIPKAMGRSFGLPLLIVSLAVGGFLFVRQAQTAGPSSTVAARAETRAAAAGAATDFAAAQPVLQAWFADNGTYAGASLPPVYGVVVARADASSFCLQAGSGATATHELGPGGQPQSGPC
jgi:hypothetical protein